MLKIYKLSCALTVLLFISSCATTKLTSTWKDKDYTGGNYKSVLIVGAAEKLTNRIMFEDALVKQFKSIGIDAFSSFSVTSPNKAVDKDTIKAAAKKQGAEAVLVTHFIRVEKKDVYVPPMSHPVPYGSRYQFDNYYRAVVDYAHVPGYTTQQEYVTLESNLFETRTEKMIWSATSETFEPKSVKEVIDALSKVVIKSLREYQLIK